MGPKYSSILALGRKECAGGAVDALVDILHGLLLLGLLLGAGYLLRGECQLFLEGINLLLLLLDGCLQLDAGLTLGSKVVLQITDGMVGETTDEQEGKCNGSNDDDRDDALL